MNGTTLRVCAGWRLDLLLKGSDMEKLKAKQTVSNLTEAEAIEQAKEGDAAAFEFLYKAHCRRVYSLCLRMIKNPAEAEDLTQQAFLQLFRKIGTFRGESGFSTWLHRVTVNIVLMHIRRHKPAEFPVEDLERYSSNGEGPFEDGSSDTSMLGAIDRLNLMRAIRKLPAGYKKLFLMHDVIGYEHSEIAGLLGCSIGCSKSQVHKARKKLRRLLQGEHRRGEAGVAPAWEEADAGSLLDLTKLPEGDGEQVLANVVVEGEPPAAVMPAAASRHALYGSCAEDVAAWAIARQCPQPVSPLPIAVSIPPGALNGIDRYYVLCTRDRAIPPSLQRRMVAENPCAGVIELDTDHTPQLSMTNELAKALHQFATHSSAGAGRLADRKDRAHFRRRQL